MLLKSDTIFTGTLVVEFGKLVKPYTFATAEPDSSNLYFYFFQPVAWQVHGYQLF